MKNCKKNDRSPKALPGGLKNKATGAYRPLRQRAASSEKINRVPFPC